MPAGRPAGDATEARRWLDQAKGRADDAEAAAVIAQTHALLALTDRLGAVLERAIPSSRVPVPQQEAADHAAIDRAIAQGRPEADAVLRFVRDELGVDPLAYQEQMLRRLVTASLREHPLQAADRAWYEAQKRNAVAAGDAQALREATDEHNRARQDSVYDPAQRMRGVDPSLVVLDEGLPPDGPTWATTDEVAAVQAAEAQIDPDVAATNAARRRMEREQAQLDRAVRRGSGIFGQMGPSEEDA